jgi:hypothetical protein
MSLPELIRRKIMAEELKVGEVRCSQCKKKVMITEEHCPNCGAKTDPTGRLVGFMVSALVVGICLVFLGAWKFGLDTSGAEPSLLVFFPVMIGIGIFAIVLAAGAGGLIALNKKMRKKAFEEMGKPQ